MEHVTVKLRRADVVRIKAELEKLGSMFITDWGNAVSYMTAEEIIKAAGNAGARKLHEYQARRDAGETFDAVSRAEDDSEADDDDVTQEEIDAATRWGAHGASPQGRSLERTEKVTRLGELQFKQSALTERINALNIKGGLSAEEMVELREKQAESQKLAPEIRTALALEDEADKLAREASPDPELRERLELRGRVSFARYLNVNARGGLPDGAEGELNAACKVPGAAIPFDVWEPTLEQRQREQRALTPAPSTGTGVNVQPILPAIFDPSIAPMLRVDLPSVGSGAYSEMTISTAPDAVAVAKGAEKVPSAGVLTPSTSTPKRISGGVEVSLEDEAAVGTESFDAALKNAASMSLSNQLDEEIINGPNSGNRLNGLLAQLDATDEPVGTRNMGQLQPGRASRRGRNLGEGLIRTARAHRRDRMGFERSRVS